MNKLITLMRREYWENKGALRTTPIVIGGIYILLTLMALITQMTFDHESYTFKEGLRMLSQHPVDERSFIFYQIQLGPFSGLFTTVLAFAVFFYLLGSLYDDRKDKSILFWKSLPASDSLTMSSKLLTAMLVAPLIYWLVLVVTHILVMAVFSLMILGNGFNPWELFLQHAQPVRAWGMLLATYLAQSVWALPLYGWLMLVSAFAPRLPILFAVLPPVIFGFLQLWITFLRTFTFGRESLFPIIGEWFAGSPVIMSVQIDDHDVGTSLGIPITDNFDHAVTLANVVDRMLSVQMAVGLLVAAVLLLAAWWLRRRAMDS